MKFTDNVALSGTRETNDGYLIAEVRCARIGTQTYAGYELGVDMPTVTVYRDEAEVFNTDSLASFVGKPTTDDHPFEPVTADNWKQHAVGSIGEGVLRDGEYIKVPITLMDKQIISKVKSGKAEISMGYTADMVFGDGVSPTGEAYQAKQTNIRINHLAIVDAGRAGSKCRIGDNATPWGKSPLTNDTGITMKTIIIDGKTVETTDAGLATIQQMVDEKNAIKQQLADEAAAKADALKAKDAELAAKDAEIDTIKGEQLTDEQIDAKVQARAALLTVAKTIAKDAKFEGLSDADIRKAAVVAVIGDKALEGKSGAYIDARFDILAETATNSQGGDQFADSLKGRNQHAPQSADRGQSSYEQRLANAYKGAAPTTNTQGA